MPTRNENKTNRSKAELVTIEDVLCISETAKAIQVNINNKKAWIPKSLIDDDSEVYQKGDEGDLVLPEWFAVKEGLV